MRLKRPAFLLLVIFCLFGLILSACQELPQSEDDPEPDSGIIKTIAPATLTAISELAAPTQTPEPQPLGMDWPELEGLELQFWYIWDLDEPGEGMNEIVARFNQENEWGITVIPHDQGLVLDPLAAVETAFEAGERPHVMVSDASLIAGWYQAGLIADLDPFLDDPVVGLPENDLKAFYPGIFSVFVLNGTARLGVPFSQSIQAIYYNTSWAEELDILSLPLTAEDLLEQSCSIAGDGDFAGMVLSPQAENILSFIYAYRGDPLLAVEEGYRFSSWEIRKFAGDWRELSREGCGQLVSNYPNPMAIEGEYERFNRREALMIMGSSLMQHHIQMGPDQAGKADRWEMVAFPGPDGTRAVTSQVQSAVLFKTTPEVELASWLFLKYLTSPEVQAEWSLYSGYYPTRKDSLPYLEAFRAENPSWASGLSLLHYSRSAPLHPSWQIVKLAVEDAFEEILLDPGLGLYDQLYELDLVAAELLEWDLE